MPSGKAFEKTTTASLRVDVVDMSLDKFERFRRTLVLLSSCLIPPRLPHIFETAESSISSTLPPLPPKQFDVLTLQSLKFNPRRPFGHRDAQSDDIQSFHRLDDFGMEQLDLMLVFQLDRSSSVILMDSFKATECPAPRCPASSEPPAPCQDDTASQRLNLELAQDISIVPCSPYRDLAAFPVSLQHQSGLSLSPSPPSPLMEQNA
ncbi:hypothetical protein Ae201684_017839 [Aphanomyces euteiches]|uniref:Uncharacterized protein n=1 Tax=Aphanomyces euteiches TaxID=100861 RepID=A0A6G0W7X0_9STRA|nr:hypothetical protein Ae201684_017839 [Aphanomyces euteiches]